METHYNTKEREDVANAIYYEAIEISWLGKNEEALKTLEELYGN